MRDIKHVKSLYDIDTSRMSPFYKAYVRARQWLQPYWLPDPHTFVKHAKIKADVYDEDPSASLSTRGKTTSFKFIDQQKRIRDVQSKDFKRPRANECYTYHDDHFHQVFVRLEPGSVYTYPSNTRSDKDRKKLMAAIWPVNCSEPVHRTHMVKYGYHGLENDERLVIGWRESANVGAFNDFEQKYAQWKQPIYWFCSVELARSGQGARWTYRVFDMNMRQIDMLVDEMTNEFIWRDYREMHEERLAAQK